MYVHIYIQCPYGDCGKQLTLVPFGVANREIDANITTSITDAMICTHGNHFGVNLNWLKANEKWDFIVFEETNAKCIAYLHYLKPDKQVKKDKFVLENENEEVNGDDEKKE